MTRLFDTDNGNRELVRRRTLLAARELPIEVAPNCYCYLYLEDKLLKTLNQTTKIDGFLSNSIDGKTLTVYELNLKNANDILWGYGNIDVTNRQEEIGRLGINGNYDVEITNFPFLFANFSSDTITVEDFQRLMNPRIGKIATKVCQKQYAKSNDSINNINNYRLDFENGIIANSTKTLDDLGIHLSNFHLDDILVASNELGYAPLNEISPKVKRTVLGVVASLLIAANVALLATSAYAKSGSSDLVSSSVASSVSVSSSSLVTSSPTTVVTLPLTLEYDVTRMSQTPDSTQPVTIIPHVTEKYADSSIKWYINDVLSSTQHNAYNWSFTPTRGLTKTYVITAELNESIALTATVIVSPFIYVNPNFLHYYDNNQHTNNFKIAGTYFQVKDAEHVTVNISYGSTAPYVVSLFSPPDGMKFKYNSIYGDAYGNPNGLITFVLSKDDLDSVSNSSGEGFTISFRAANGSTFFLGFVPSVYKSVYTYTGGIINE